MVSNSIERTVWSLSGENRCRLWFYIIEDED
jgi:hypothetical protein